jgi:voltage-gated potassium channel
MMRPHVVQFLDFTTTTNLGEDISIEQVPVSPKSRMIAKTIREMQIGSEYGVIVMAIRHSDGTMVFNPAADAPLRGGDFLIVMGRQEGLRALEEVLGK